jgi:hypothetical protein
MKAGRNLPELATLIRDTHNSKRDYIASTSALQMVTLTPTVATDATPTRPDVGLQFTVRGENRVYRPTKLCLDQIAQRVGVPAGYAEKMRQEAPGLLATNVNHWFTAKPEQRMLRTLNHGNNVARAFLSDRYRALDNYDLFAAVAPKLQAAGCEIHSSEITETRFYLQASTPRIQAIIDQEIKTGGHNRIQRTVQAGVIIGNSEVGCGSIFIDPIMYDLVCTNGLILQRTLKRHHVGRRGEGEMFGDEASFELFSDETRQADDKAFWLKVSDVVTAALDQIKFNENIERLRRTQTQILAESAKEVKDVVEVTSEKFELVEAEKDALLLHFMQGGDFSKYGLINAITRTASDVESYDRAVDLERLGGKIIELPKSDLCLN